MAVVSVTETWRGRDSSDGDEVRIFQIFTDSILDTARDARLDTRVPQKGEGHPEDGYKKCQTVRCTPEGPTNFKATCRYADAGWGGAENPDGEPQSPLSQPVRIVWSAWYEDETIDTDIHNKPLINSNGEIIEGITQRKARRRVTITRNLAQFEPTQIDVYEGSVNVAEFLGAPPYTLRCEELRAESVSEPGWDYWTVSGSFTLNKRKRTDNEAILGWRRAFLNEGFLQRVFDDQDPPQPKAHPDGGFYLEEIRDYNGNPVARPQLLTPAGDRVRPGQGPFFKVFETYPKMDFSELQLLNP